MHKEISHTGASSPNRLSEFVVDNVSSYDHLNAVTQEEAKDTFESAVAEALSHNFIENEEIGSGAFYDVHALKDDDRVVVKRLRTGGWRANAGLDELWREIQEDHQTIARYLGAAFIPDTEFVTLKSDSLLSDEGLEAQSSDCEYIAVQERAVGKRLDELSKDFQPSPDLKSSIGEYVVRCEQMMREGMILDHPDDVMINDAPNVLRRVTLLDTNFLARFKDVADNRNSRIFLEEYNIDPASIKTPEDIMHMIHELVPSLLQMGPQETEDLRSQDYSALMHRLRGMQGDLSFALRDALRKLPNNLESVPAELRDNQFLDQLLFGGFDALVSLLDRCAPKGQHPQELLRIMNTFGIDDDYLRDCTRT